MPQVVFRGWAIITVDSGQCVTAAGCVHWNPPWRYTGNMATEPTGMQQDSACLKEDFCCVAHEPNLLENLAELIALYLF